MILLLMLAAMIGDGCTTWYGIERAGLREANILPAALMARLGTVPAILATKLPLAAVAMGWYALDPDSGVWFAGVVAAGHIGVVAWNLRKTRRA